MATAPLRLPDLAFEDADGKPKKLSDWRGRTVLVNLWATWCVPCRKEMPALEGLETKLGGPDFAVVAINIDTRDPEKAKNFLKDANLTRLGHYNDQKAKVFQDLKSIGRALGMPTSVLVDGQGCEIATIAGPAEWDSDDAVKLITAAAGSEAGERHAGWDRFARSVKTKPRRYVEIAADAGGDIGQRRGVLLARPQQGHDRGFLRIDIRFQDRGGDLHLQVARLSGEKAADQAHIHTQHPNVGQLPGRN